MLKDKNRILLENSSKIMDTLTSYVEEMDRLSGTKEFTIDNIEKLWDKLDNNTKEIYKTANREIMEQVNEKELISSKKENMPKRGCF